MENAATGMVISHETRLAHIEEKIDALSGRFEDVIVTQQKDHGKRLREAETKIQAISEALSREEGKKEGAKAILILIGALVSSLGGIAGAIFSKLF